MSNIIHVLVVDDSLADRKLLEFAFRKAGGPVQLHFCANGSEALNFLCQRDDHVDAPRPQACLLDINMPGLSGFDVLKQLKSDPGLKTIAVVMLSSSAEPADITQAYQNCASSYIQKPLRAAELEDMAKSLVHLWSNIVKFADPIT